MSGLIEEIQRDAMNESISIAALLRKVKVAASKLSLPPTQAWVDHELNGYAGIELPAYRKLPGKVRAFNPYNGWIPVVIGNDELDRMLSTCAVRESVTSIEALLQRNETSFVTFPLSPEVISDLNQMLDIPFGNIAVHLSTSQVHGLLGAVRDLVLDWALKLERAGVRGEGMSFNREEQILAHNSPTTYNIGSIGSFNGILGHDNVAGNITASGISVQDTASLVDQLDPHIQELARSGADRAKLEKALADLRTECAKPSPQQSILRGALTDLRNTLSGAAGSLVASGALTVIAKLLGM